MRATGSAWTVVVYVVAVAGFIRAQSPRPGVAPAKPASEARPPADLAQLMKGIVYTNSNVVFAAQGENPDEIKPDPKAAVSPNPLTSVFGKWQAVENSALALAESASLLMVPGRTCSNGVDVPIRNADWAVLVQGMREAGMTAYKAAQSKNQDNILSAAEAVTTSCENCHRKYRERRNVADRCR